MLAVTAVMVEVHVLLPFQEHTYAHKGKLLSVALCPAIHTDGCLSCCCGALTAGVTQAVGVGNASPKSQQMAAVLSQPCAQATGSCLPKSLSESGLSDCDVKGRNACS